MITKEELIKDPNVCTCKSSYDLHGKVNFNCMDCATDTMNDMYMVFDKIWRKVNPKQTGMLCRDCLEKRLGRKLVDADYTKALINIQPCLYSLASASLRAAMASHAASL